MSVFYVGEGREREREREREMPKDKDICRNQDTWSDTWT